MKTIARNSLLAAVAAGVVISLVGCSSATPTDTPGVDRLGQYILRQEGPELWAVLGYRFATSQLGNEWLILDVNLTSPNGQTATVRRENVFVQTPGGTKIPVATQKEFNEAYGGLRPTLVKANVDRDPLDYFPLNRAECTLQFFTTPGGGVAYDQVTLNDFRACYGRLLFKVNGGIQAGRWVFGIDLPESEIRIPFELGK
jgi:hypothetical protein